MPALERISGGPFPSLFRLYMHELSRLKEVWIVRVACWKQACHAGVHDPPNWCFLIQGGHEDGS